MLESCSNVSNGNDQFACSLASMVDQDGDGVVDLAVGAPGCILFKCRKDSVCDYTLIRGEYIGINVASFNASRISNYTYNDTRVSYGCRFDSASATTGDIHFDNVVDSAASMADNRIGTSNVLESRALHSDHGLSE
jgi:hypothetical protein